jgi:mercuric reductase
MSAASYDVIVIGSGSAGFSAAEAARSLGASVCMVEKEKLGGECPNWACVPSKALLKCAKVMRVVREAESFGVLAGGARVDFTRMMDYRRSVVQAITGGERGERYERLTQKLGIDVVQGQATFIDDHTIEAGGTRYFGKTFVIATGSSEFVPPVLGLDKIRFLTSRDALTLTRQPKALAIIGGGPVGSEIATFFQTIGTRVILLQTTPTILNREDAEISRLAHEAMQARGVEVVGGAQVNEIVDGRGGVYGVRASSGGDEKMHAVDQVLVAAGKRSNVSGLNIEQAGVKLDQRGTIVTDLRQRTSTPHVFAAGDVNGGLMFTHTAHYEGTVAGHNAALAALRKRNPPFKRDERVVPRVTFVDPEVASVGMTAEEAKKSHKKILVGRFHVASLGRAVTEHARQGLVKMVAHPKSRKILGCHIMAERAGEMIHEAALAMHVGATVDKIASMIHAYPTYNEALAAAAGSVVTE